MRDDFCAFILTHGRPDKVLTYRTLRRAGYTGKIFIVVDDEDKTRNQYMAEFGEQVLVFSKADIASRFDEADNFCDRRSIFYARNACFDLAKLVGCKYFIQLDDDYHEFQFRVDRNYDQAYFPIRKLDAILSEMLAYYESIPALSIAMSQGGDFLGDNGGHASWVKRKAMNSFICSVDRPFSFMGRINEDVNTYTNLGRCGELFMTIGAVQLGQKQTQKNSGGMTELYLDSGTYVKSFYSVMYAPSCVKISLMGASHKRIHHQVTWNNAAVKILHEKYRKKTPCISMGVTNDSVFESRVSGSVPDALDNILQIMAEWIGESCGGNVDVRTELDVSAQVFDSSSALAVQSLRQGGDIRQIDAVRVLQALKFIDQDSRPEEVIDELKNQSVMLMEINDANRE